MLETSYPSSTKRLLLVPLPSVLIDLFFCHCLALMYCAPEDTNHFLFKNIVDLFIGEQAIYDPKLIHPFQDLINCFVSDSGHNREPILRLHF
jgi:hypothetical protein